jgi:predicted NUDIX family NTP pyrophosphohydrolase
MASFPEVDRYGYFALDEAAEKLNAGQRPLLVALADAVMMQRPSSPPRT